VEGGGDSTANLGWFVVAILWFHLISFHFLFILLMVMYNFRKYTKYKKAIHNQDTCICVRSVTEKEQGEEKSYFACPLSQNINKQ